MDCQKNKAEIYEDREGMVCIFMVEISIPSEFPKCSTWLLKYFVSMEKNVLNNEQKCLNEFLRDRISMQHLFHYHKRFQVPFFISERAFNWNCTNYKRNLNLTNAKMAKVRNSHQRSEVIFFTPHFPYVWHINDPLFLLSSLFKSSARFL